jgi:hypothetical protein
MMSASFAMDRLATGLLSRTAWHRELGIGHNVWPGVRIATSRAMILSMSRCFMFRGERRGVLRQEKPRLQYTSEITKVKQQV